MGVMRWNMEMIVCLSMPKTQEYHEYDANHDKAVAHQSFGCNGEQGREDFVEKKPWPFPFLATDAARCPPSIHTDDSHNGLLQYVRQTSFYSCPSRIPLIPPSTAISIIRITRTIPLIIHKRAATTAAMRIRIIGRRIRARSAVAVTAVPADVACAIAPTGSSGMQARDVEGLIGCCEGETLRNADESCEEEGHGGCGLHFCWLGLFGVWWEEVSGCLWWVRLRTRYRGCWLAMICHVQCVDLYRDGADVVKIRYIWTDGCEKYNLRESR